MKSIKNDKKRVAVGLSGGVDSAVAAALLQEQGYDVTGVYMQCWDDKADGCKSDEDRAFALQNATKLGINFISLDFRERYKNKVISYFYSEYKAGRTPNPDVMCNKEIKFGIFYEWALQNNFDFVATGHYSRVVKDDTPGTNIAIDKGKNSLSHLKRHSLFMGKDKTKDQSYFLYILTPDQLSRVLFPIGNMKKTQVREKAISLSLPSAKRPESMGICFIGEVDIKAFLKKRLEPKEGSVLDLRGNIIGRHEGVWYYTIGQRHGFKIDVYVGKPLYVVSKSVDNNTLVVGGSDDACSKSFSVGDLNWIDEPSWLSPDTVDDARFFCDVRIRHLGKLYKCSVQKKYTDESSYTYTVTLDQPVFAVAPGQSAVFYIGEKVIGGGIIQNL